MAEVRPPQRGWDDYFIPGTSVLRNKFTGPAHPYGESDQAKLTTLEEQRTRLRLMQLRTAPISGRFDYEHMKAIHRHVFQDVYEWAGQERTAPTGPMLKAGHAYYPAGPALTAAAEAEYSKLAQADHLRGLERGAFVEQLAERWGELNVVHSFREGNTRTQFAFFFQLCEQAGYRLDTEAFRPGNPLREEFVQARFHSQDTGSNAQLASVLDKAITAAPPASTQAQGSSAGLGAGVRAASFPRLPGAGDRSGSSTAATDAAAAGRARGYERGEPGVGR